MPIPRRKPSESEDAFMSRCMGDPAMREEFPDEAQRLAVCGQALHSYQAGLYKAIEIKIIQTIKAQSDGKSS